MECFLCCREVCDFEIELLQILGDDMRDRSAVFDVEYSAVLDVKILLALDIVSDTLFSIGYIGLWTNILYSCGTGVF